MKWKLRVYELQSKLPESLLRSLDYRSYMGIPGGYFGFIQGEHWGQIGRCGRMFGNTGGNWGVWRDIGQVLGGILEGYKVHGKQEWNLLLRFRVWLGYGKPHGKAHGKTICDWQVYRNTRSLGFIITSRAVSREREIGPCYCV